METQNRGMELALLLTLPATVALIVCGQPIVAALFEHGKFTATNSYYTAQALAAFSIGLPSYILVKVLTPGYYARPIRGRRCAMRPGRCWSIWG